MKKVISLFIAALFFIGVNPLLACDCDAPPNNLSMTLTATQVTFGANKSYSGACGSYAIQVELKIVGQAFDGTTNLYISNAGYIAGAGAIPLNPVTITLASIYSTLGPGQVKWRVRQLNQSSCATGWTESTQLFFSCTGAAAGPITAGGPTTFCQGGSVVLTSEAGTVYQWFRNNSVIAGATSQNYTATTSGAYSVSNTVNGCPSPVVNVTAQVPPTTSVSASATTIPFGGSTTLTGTFQSTRVYLVPLADLLNMPNNCGSGSFYGSNNQGVRWTDIGSGIVTNVQIEFSVGVECHTGTTFTTVLNGAAGPTYGQTPYFCSCGIPPSVSIVTLNFPNPAVYNLGGVNNFNITNSVTAMGMIPAASLGNVYARVTVTYGLPAGTTFAWNPGNLTTNPVTVSPASTTTYTLTTNNGICSTAVPITITVLPPPVSFTLTSTNESCVGAGDGSITVTVTGGSGPIEYSLNNAAFVPTNVFTGLGAGNYQVRIKDGAYISAPQNIVVVTTPDTQPPTITCPPPVTVQCSSEVPNVDVESVATSDNCNGTVSVTHEGDVISNQTCANRYTITRTYKATDAAGNFATCTQIINVYDNTAPVITCPSNIVVNNTPGQCGANVSFTATATDNCGSATLSYSIASGSFFSQGTTTVIVTATDVCGNTANCSFTVTVNDTENPIITCPGPIVRNNDAGQCSAVVNFATPGATDNCGNSGDVRWVLNNITFTDGGTASGSFDYNAGTNTISNWNIIVSGGNPVNFPAVSYTPSNSTRFNAGNFIQFQQNVLVSPFSNLRGLRLETISPKTNTGGVLPLSSNINLNLECYNCSPFRVMNSGGSLIGTPLITIAQTAGLPSGSTFPVGTTTNTFTATDAAGNLSTCSFTVTVVDNENPTINCPSDIIVCGSQVVNYNIPTATDNCTIAITQTSGLPSGSVFPVGTTVNTFTATDPSGNSASCSFNVTINPIPAVNTIASQTICNNGATAAVNFTGTVPGTVYNWTNNITSIGLAASGTGDIASFTALNPTNAPVTATITVTPEFTSGGLTCTGQSLSFTIRVNPTAVVNPVNNKVVCFGAAPGATNFSSTTTGGPIVYSWTNNTPAIGLPASGTGNIPNFVAKNTTNAPLVATITVTPSFGTAGNCLGTARTFTITVNPTPNFDNAQYFSGILSASDPVYARPEQYNQGGICAVSVNPTAGSAVHYRTHTFTLAEPSNVVVSLLNSDGGLVVPTGNNINIDPFLQLVGPGGFNPASSCTNSIAANDDAGFLPQGRLARIATTTPLAAGTYTVVVTTWENTPGVLPQTIIDLVLPWNYTLAVLTTSQTVCNNSATTALNFNTTVPGTVFNWTNNNTSIGLAASGSGSIPSFTAINTGINPVTATITVTPSYTNAGLTCFGAPVRYNITVNPTPTITCPGNQTVSNIGGTCGAVVNYNSSATGTPTPAISYTFSGVTSGSGSGNGSGSTFNVGVTTVTLTATNECGAPSCSFTVTVVDDELPTITCNAPIEVSNEEGQCGAIVTYTVTSTDNCPGQTVAQTAGLPSGSVFPVGVTTNTFVVTDASGNTATCSFTVTVNDAENPTITCNAPIVVSNDEGQCGAIVTYTVTSADNCPGQTVAQTAGLASGSVFPVGVTTNTFVVTDAIGNTATCSFTVTVNDNESPTFACPANIIVSTGTGSTSCSQTATWTPPTVTDNCGTVTVTSSHNPGDVFPVGTTTVTYTFRDAANNQSACSFTVTVNDNTPPVAVCQNATVILGPSGVRNFNVESQVVQFNPTGFSPNNVPLLPVGVMPGVTASSLSQIGAPFNTFNNGVWPVGNNLSTPALNPNHYLTFTVNLPTPTTLNRLVYTKLSYFGNGPRWAAIRTSVNGFSSDLSTVSVSPSGQQILNFNLSALAPVMGSITFRIYFYGATSNGDWADLVSTARSGGTGLVLYSNTNTLISLINGGSYDNCGPVSLSASQSIFTCANVGPNNVVLTVKDQFGNTSSCTAVVNVVDNIAPTITCPAPIVRNNDLNQCGAMVTYAVTSADNCPGQAVTQTAGLASGSVFPVGVTTNTFMVTDASGNTATCSFTVTVNDNQNPVITCPANVTVNCQDDNSSVATGTATAIDNCTPAVNIVITQSQTSTQTASGAGQYNYIITRTWRATDVTGNFSECVQTITVQDVTAPVITCPADVTVNCQDENTSAATGVATGTDLCSAVVITQSQTSTQTASGAGQYNYIITRTWKATDVTGNYSECVQTITVQDVTAPVITCPGNITVNNDLGICGAIVNFAATATDNCSPVTITYSKNPGTVFIVGTTTVVATATDVSGNFTTCSFTVTVNDNENPIITCRDTAIRLTNAGLCTYKVQNAEFDATATDNCGVTSLTYVLSGATNGTGSGTMQSLKNVLLTRGTTTVTWTAKDAANNPSTCSFTVTVNDDQNNTPYLIYAEKDVEFGEYNYIGGDVGVTAANGKAKFKKNSVLDPFTIRAKDIDVHMPASVNNRVYSPATGGPTPPFMVYNGSTSGLSNIDITVNGTTLNGNWKDVKVKKGITCFITGNNFGKITIEEGANVTFRAAVINLEKMDVQNGKKQNNILTVVNFTNPAWVKVKDKVDIGDDCRVNVGGPKVTFYMGDNSGGEEKFEVKGENSQVTANIMIPNGKLHVHGGNDITRPTIMTGWYIIEKLDSHEKYVYWNKYDCGTSNLPFVQQSTQPEVKPVVPVVVTTTVTQPADEFRVNVYPNPSAYDFSIQVSSKSNEPVTVRILDMNGKLMSVHAQQTKANNIRVGDKLVGGTYIAEVIQGANRKTLKLVKLN